MGPVDLNGKYGDVPSRRECFISSCGGSCSFISIGMCLSASFFVFFQDNCLNGDNDALLIFGKVSGIIGLVSAGMGLSLATYYKCLPERTNNGNLLICIGVIGLIFSAVVTTQAFTNC